MYKTGIAVFCIVIGLMTSVSALSLDAKTEYQPRETLIAEIQGTVLEPITADKIELVRNGYLQVPVEYGIQKLGEQYFIYMVMPQASNNYTLIIHNVSTTLNGQTTSLDIRHNLTVNGSTIPYFIKPGFALLANKTTFTLTVTGDQSIPVRVGGPIDRNYTLRSGDNSIVVENIFPPGFNRLQIGAYTIPIYALSQESILNRKITFFPHSIEAVMLRGRENTIPFRIVNDFDAPLTDIVIIYDDSFFSVSPSKIAVLKANESLDINLTIKSKSASFSDRIFIEYGDENYELPIRIDYTERNDSVMIPYLNNYSQGQGKYCSELKGAFCSTGYSCTGQLIAARDGTCCVGVCNAPSETSYAWAGYLIGLIIAIVLIIIGARYLKTKRSGKVLR